MNQLFRDAFEKVAVGNLRKILEGKKLLQVVKQIRRIRDGAREMADNPEFKKLDPWNYADRTRFANRMNQTAKDLMSGKLNPNDY